MWPQSALHHAWLEFECPPFLVKLGLSTLQFPCSSLLELTVSPSLQLSGPVLRKKIKIKLGNLYWNIWSSFCIFLFYWSLSPNFQLYQQLLLSLTTIYVFSTQWFSDIQGFSSLFLFQIFYLSINLGWLLARIVCFCYSQIQSCSACCPKSENYHYIDIA